MKRAFLFLLLCTCLLLSGCGNPVFGDDSREIDQLELVETVGIDATRELTTVTASTGTLSGEPVLLKNTAVTVSRAVREMQNYTDRQYIFYGHAAHILIGEAAARQDLNRFLDYIERDSEVRLDTKLYIVQGGTAEDAISAVSNEEETAGELLESLDRDVQLLSESYVFNCGEVAQMLAKRGCALVAAVMLENVENILDSDNSTTIQSTGYAVIQGEKLRCFLDTNLSRGVNLLIDRTGSDVVEAPDGAGGWFAARLTGSETKYTPVFEDGKLSKVKLDVTLHCNLDELHTPLDIYDGAVIRKLEEGVSVVEAWRIREVLNRMQTLCCDFCDLQTRVRKASAWRFDRMGEPWETIFPTLEFEVSVKTMLERTYDVGLSPLGNGRNGE